MRLVGNFMTTSGRLRITDPCYDRDTWCAGAVDNCVRGEWEAFTEKHEVECWGERNSLILVKAKGHVAIGDWELLNIDVGVDSGQAGVFDDVHFKSNLKAPVELIGRKEYDRKSYERRVKENEDLLKDLQDNANLRKIFGHRHEDAVEMLRMFDARPTEVSSDFYDVCCSLTLSNVGAGTLEYGAVSTSGFGDGSYTAFCRRNSSGEIVELKIIFINDSEEELIEDDFDYDDEPAEESGSGTFFLGGKL